MSTLTREETAHIVSRYHGTEYVLVQGDIVKSAPMTVDWECLKMILLNPSGYQHKLLLTEVKNITEEQILQLCKVYAPTIFGDYRYNKWTIKQDGNKTDTWDTVIIERSKDDFSFQLDKIDGEIRLFDKDVVETACVNHYYQQWYFKNGFAVPLFFGMNHPCNGKTAIECGIAIVKQ